MSIFEITLVHSACTRVRVSFILDLKACMGRADYGRRVQWKGKATDTVSKLGDAETVRATVLEHRVDGRAVAEGVRPLPHLRPRMHTYVHTVYDT